MLRPEVAATKFGKAVRTTSCLDIGTGAWTGTKLIPIGPICRHRSHKLPKRAEIVNEVQETALASARPSADGRSGQGRARRLGIFSPELDRMSDKTTLFLRIKG